MVILKKKKKKKKAWSIKTYAVCVWPQTSPDYSCVHSYPCAYPYAYALALTEAQGLLCA